MHSSPRLILDSLKRCPLCEAVNAEASDACFVCGWAGAFDRDADVLQASFEELVARCPDLAPSPRGHKALRSWTARLRRIFPKPRPSMPSPAEE